MVKGQLHLQKWLGCDFVLGFVDVWVFAEAVGVKLDFPDNNTPSPVESPVKESEDIEKLHVPDPKKYGRLPIIVEGIDRLRTKVGGKIAIYTGGQGPFSLAAEIRGLQAFLKDFT
jgi:uroporphyrinogen decarboxylase